MEFGSTSFLAQHSLFLMDYDSGAFKQLPVIDFFKKNSSHSFGQNIRQVNPDFLSNSSLNDVAPTNIPAHMIWNMTVQIKLPIHSVEYKRGGHAEALLPLLQATDVHTRGGSSTWIHHLWHNGRLQTVGTSAKLTERPKYKLALS